MPGVLARKACKGATGSPPRTTAVIRPESATARSIGPPLVRKPLSCLAFQRSERLSIIYENDNLHSSIHKVKIQQAPDLKKHRHDFLRIAKWITRFPRCSQKIDYDVELIIESKK